MIPDHRIADPPPPRRRRILVTGGAGFIGSHLVGKLVAAGLAVDVLHRPESDLRRLGKPDPAVRLWPGDLLDVDRLRDVLQAVRPEIIYHLAGDASLRHFDAALAGVAGSIERNLRASMNLVVAAANAGPPELALLVRLGGLEEYGRGPLPYDEAQRERPVSPYSASQVAVTHYLQMLADRLPFRSVTLRPALVYGPRQSKDFFIPALIEACLRGRDFRVATANQGRDLLYVGDLVDALLRLAEVAVPPGEIINVGTGREHLMSEVAAAIVRLTGAGIRLVEEDAPRPGQIEHLYCSSRKARELLGWQAAHTLEAGLRLTIDSFRSTEP